MPNDSELHVIVDGMKITATKEENLLELLRRNGFRIPTLCYHPGLPPYGSCRLCTVEVQEDQRARLVASCTYPVRVSGIEVYTRTEEVTELRKAILKLLLARSPSAETVRKLAREYEVEEDARLISGSGTERENEERERCILCGLCVRACNEVLQRNAISFTRRGINREVAPPLHLPPETCTACGACTYVCPTGAVYAVVEEGRKRVVPWGAEREWQRCPDCGREHYVGEVVQEVKTRYASQAPGAEEIDYFSLCNRCKRKRTARLWSNGIIH